MASPLISDFMLVRGRILYIQGPGSGFYQLMLDTGPDFIHFESGFGSGIYQAGPDPVCVRILPIPRNVRTVEKGCIRHLPGVGLGRLLSKTHHKQCARNIQIDTIFTVFA